MMKLKTYRRVEITAFRHRVGFSACVDGPDQTSPTEFSAISLFDTEAGEPVDPASDEGRRIIRDAIDTLREAISE